MTEGEGKGPRQGKGRGKRRGEQLAELTCRPDVKEREVGLDLVLYDPASQKVHMLNAVAAAVWRHIGPDRSFKNIAEALQLSFSIVDPDDVYDDVEELLEELREAGLLIRPDREPPRSEPEVAEIQIPDGEITTLLDGYERPAIKSFTLEELEELVSVSTAAPAPFADMMPTTLD